MPLFCVPQNVGFSFFLSLPDPNTCLENIYVFDLPLFKAVMLLEETILEEPLHSQVTPMVLSME